MKVDTATGRVDVDMLANYPLEDSRSMLAYANLLETTLSGIDTLRIRRMQPAVLLGGFTNNLHIHSHLLYNIDKQIAAHWSVARSPAPILHIVDHSYAWYAQYSQAQLKIATCHDLHPFLAEAGELKGWQPSRRFRYRMKQIAAGLRECAAIVCVSHATRCDLERLLGIPSNRITVIYNCLRDHLPSLTPEQMVAHRRACGLDEDDKIVVLLGGAIYKNCHGAINAFAAAKDRLPNNTVLCLVSEPTAALEAQISSNKLSSRVRFLPRLSDERLSALLRSSAVLLAPSLYEGFGWPVIEAQSVGVPVVCSTAGALSEVAGHAALFAAPDDYEGIAEHLVRVLSDLQLAAELRHCGKENVRRFGFDNWRHLYENFYTTVLNTADSTQTILGDCLGT